MLDKRVALITGGARGIGKGIAHALLQANAKVMIADLKGETKQKWNYKLSDQGTLQATKAELAAYGEVEATEVDVTKAASCRAACEAAVQRFGGLDILVNNAGVIQTGPINEFKEGDWDRCFAVNTKGIFLMVKAALPALRRSDKATILNTASVAGKKGHPNMAAYCGSKFAAIGITQSLAMELAPDNITVNALCPGLVGTAMWFDHLMPTNATGSGQKSEEFDTAMETLIPLKRGQTVEDMGAAALYLIGAPNVTGVALTVAGGFEMH